MIKNVFTRKFAVLSELSNLYFTIYSILAHFSVISVDKSSFSPFRLPEVVHRKKKGVRKFSPHAPFVIL